MPIFDDQWFIDLMKKAYLEHRHRSNLAHACKKIDLCIKEMQDAVNAQKMFQRAMKHKELKHNITD